MYYVSLFFHLIGVGLLFCGMASIPIVESMFRKEPDQKSAYTLHKVISKLGILTPVASGLLLISGIVNIISAHIVLYREGWLIIKLVLFILLLFIGMYQGKCYRQRGALVEILSLGNAPETAQTHLKLYTQKLTKYSIIQTLLLFFILLITIFRVYL